MRTTIKMRLGALAALSLSTTGLTAMVATPAQAIVPDLGAVGCVVPAAAAPHAKGDQPVREGKDTEGPEITPARSAAIEAQADKILAAKNAKLGADFAATVPTYVHVMQAKNGDGNVTDDQIKKMIQVVNRGFLGKESSAAADTGLTFVLKGIDHYKNDAWHQDKQTLKYRAQTREGGKNALNVWLVDFAYLGVATFPWNYKKHGEVDGVRVHYDSLPGGSIANYNKGKTATHEIGHWAGLFHTFQEGCSTPGDRVDDTPYEASPASACPTGRDTCDAAGLDPIHNYMDYTYDDCYNQFTPGQAARVEKMWKAYRG